MSLLKGLRAGAGDADQQAALLRSKCSCIEPAAVHADSWRWERVQGSSCAALLSKLEDVAALLARSSSSSRWAQTPLKAPSPSLHCRMHELQVGQRYELVVTTTQGLWRYQMGDVLRCVGWFGATPKVRLGGGWAACRPQVGGWGGGGGVDGRETGSGRVAAC